MPILSAEDHSFFQKNGYLIVPNAVPKVLLDPVIHDIWQFLGMDSDDCEDWYRPPLTPGGMIEMYQRQSMWNTRQSPRLYAIFSEIYNMEKLWVSIDRVNMRPPLHPKYPEYDHKGFIHWDVDTSQLPVPFGVQGVLYLSDTEDDMGGFQCVPGMHNNLQEWIDTQPPDRNPRVPDITGLQVVPIPGKAGDIVIWNRLLLAIAEHF